MMRLGKAFHQYFIISSAYGLALSRAPGADESAQKHQAVDRVAKLYYKVYATQGDSTIGANGAGGPVNKVPHLSHGMPERYTTACARTIARS